MDHERASRRQWDALFAAKNRASRPFAPPFSDTEKAFGISHSNTANGALFTSLAVRFALTRPLGDVHIFIKILMNLESGGRAVIDLTSSLAIRVQRERAAVLHALPLGLRPRRRERCAHGIGKRPAEYL